jgi:hypothetical protein
LRQEGKPEAMLDNIAKGKLARFFKDNISKPRLYQRQQIVANYEVFRQRSYCYRFQKSCFRIILNQLIIYKKAI